MQDFINLDSDTEMSGVEEPASNLPTNILNRIARYLTSPCDKLEFAKVHSSWNPIGLQHLYRELKLETVEVAKGFVTAVRNSRNKANIGYIKKINFVGDRIQDMEEKVVVFMLRNTRSLEELVIYSHLITDNVTQAVKEFKHSGSLKKLKIVVTHHESGLVDYTRFFKNLCALESLEVVVKNCDEGLNNEAECFVDIDENDKDSNGNIGYVYNKKRLDIFKGAAAVSANLREFIVIGSGSIDSRADYESLEEQEENLVADMLKKSQKLSKLVIKEVNYNVKEEELMRILKNNVGSLAEVSIFNKKFSQDIVDILFGIEGIRIIELYSTDQQQQLQQEQQVHSSNFGFHLVNIPGSCKIQLPSRIPLKLVTLKLENIIFTSSNEVITIDEDECSSSTSDSEGLLLQNLTITGNPCISSHQFYRDFLSKSKYIKELRVRNCKNISIDGEFMQYLLGTFHNLRVLVLENVMIQSNLEVQHLLQGVSPSALQQPAGGSFVCNRLEVFEITATEVLVQVVNISLDSQTNAFHSTVHGASHEQVINDYSTAYMTGYEEQDWAKETLDGNEKLYNHDSGMQDAESYESQLLQPQPDLSISAISTGSNGHHTTNYMEDGIRSDNEEEDGEDGEQDDDGDWVVHDASGDLHMDIGPDFWAKEGDFMAGLAPRGYIVDKKAENVVKITSTQAEKNEVGPCVILGKEILRLNVKADQDSKRKLLFVLYEGDDVRDAVDEFCDAHGIPHFADPLMTLVEHKLG
ncbi:hypothetical protein AX774_g8213 [Zancudomyces culisetae]|uniref:F-box domain-containing protein n=1 Tax=Zancudomyces culisetae TaxID=1213189 RepID=A0A1R1PBU6_ZANCU|nr:hypothetical protein AX774_g8213 [Zancudomyces culisetae]|eukprot:OMH78399.1 hypothetical protein AX774_g8213 [Zancudomyces culisetae]